MPLKRLERMRPRLFRDSVKKAEENMTEARDALEKTKENATKARDAQGCRDDETKLVY